MKTSLTKADLDNDLLFETLQSIHDILRQDGHELIVVGATARDIAFRLYQEAPAKRKTFDLDVAVSLGNWDAFYKVAAALSDNNFEKLPAKQKFLYKCKDNSNVYEVDLVPFGDIADSVRESIPWPPDGTPEMSVKCYNDIMAHAIDVSVEDIHFKIAPLAGQFIIKLDAWNDRNDREDKDATDMMSILMRYYDAMAFSCEDRWPDEITVDDIDDRSIMPGAEWIAVDSAKMLSTEHLRFYRDLLTHECDLQEESRLLRQMTKIDDEDPALWAVTERALRRMAEIWNTEIQSRDISQNKS